jgi:NADH dehydrogenase/NADH:ubiquinone oxidoreductase subunit G
MTRCIHCTRCVRFIENLRQRVARPAQGVD